jgi:hypothetical protein
MQDFLNYIDFIRPDLKEQAHNLSTVLPDMVYNRLQRLVLETLTPNLLPELRNKPLEELFQFAPTTNETQEVDALTSPSLDPMYTNNQLSYAQDSDEHTGASALQGKSAHLQVLDQQFNMYLEDPFYFEGTDSSAQQQSSH